MSEELLRLKSIGAQKIYEDTHIPVLHVKAILENNFDSLQKVQFVGFVSILEREYSLDLSGIKASGIAYFDDKEAMNMDESVFVTPQKKINSNAIYSVIVILIFIIVMVYQVGSFGEKESKEVLDEVLIHKVQKSIKPAVNVIEVNTTTESNTTAELNSTQAIVEVPVVVEEEVVVASFKIYTKSKVWFGYIDVDTNKKRQKTFRGEIDLDPQKRWLLIFGHAYIDMFVNDKAVKMNSRKNTRFLYEDGTVKAVSLREFKKLNRGRQW